MATVVFIHRLQSADGLGGLAGSRVQGAGGRVVGEGDLLPAQVPGHVLGGSLVPDVDSAACAPPPLSCGLGEQQMEGGQVRHDEILADVGVLRPGRIGRGGGGVAVAAPVGRLAVRPRRFHPPAANAACQQTGQQVPALPRPSEISCGRRAASGIDALGGDKISLTDQRRVRGTVRDDPSVGQVPPLHALMPQAHIAGVGQFLVLTWATIMS
jgi:hypothetical protein